MEIEVFLVFMPGSDKKIVFFFIVLVAALNKDLVNLLNFESCIEKLWTCISGN